MMLRSLLVLSVVASATCGPKPDLMPIDLPKLDAGTEADGGTGLDCRPCDAWGPVELLGPLPNVLDELSGLASSALIPGVLYAHNDSGDSARFFALGPSGFELAELHLPGANAIDWEDIAVGPCEGHSCVWLADIGDNLLQRPGYTVYRVHEPDLSAVASGSVMPPVQLDLVFDALPFLYPNATRHNAETLLVHPKTGDVYVLTKELTGQPGHVFKFPRPFTPNETVTLIDLGVASVPGPNDLLATGGDIHPCGTSVLVRLYNRNVELRAAPDAGIETAFRAAPIEVPVAVDEPQGEAIAWGADGQSYFTASENTGQYLHRVRCQRAP